MIFYQNTFFFLFCRPARSWHCWSDTVGTRLQSWPEWLPGTEILIRQLFWSFSVFHVFYFAFLDVIRAFSVWFGLFLFIFTLHNILFYALICHSILLYRNIKQAKLHLFIIQWMPLTEITWGQKETYNINWCITFSELSFPLKKLVLGLVKNA